MRVVIDTNVLVSSFFGGLPRDVVARWKHGELTLCVSRPLLDEYVEVLRRLGARDDLVRELLELWASGYHVAFTANPRPLRVVDSDPTDNMLFDCAVALKADAIITGDKAVRRIGAYMGIEVLTPAEFLARRPEPGKQGMGSDSDQRP